MTSSDPECRRLREEFAVGDWRAHPLEGWIRRGHKTAQLRPKQMELLCFFAVRPGRLLSKEELLEGVWKETVVEDGALTRCLSELRRLLGDNAQNPSYIQTLPRRGYRLIAEVLEQPTPAPPSLRPHVLNASTASEAMPSEPTQSARAAPTAALPKRQRRSLPMAAATTILALSVFLGLRTDGGRAQKKSTPPAELAAENDGRGLGSAGLATPHLAVLEFRYLTGAAELDWLASALPEVLTAELGSAPEANVVPRPAVVAAEQAMSPVALQPEARKHHLRATLGVEGLLTGSYLAAKGAGVIRLDVWLEKSPTAAVEVFSEEGRVEDVLELVSLLGARVRNRLGAPLGTAPAKAAWSHPKAARLFYEGLGMAKRFRARDASELLRESLALDPGQPVAEMALAESLSSRGRRAEALAAVERSLALERPRDRQQRLWIEAGAAEIRRQWDQALERYRALWLMAPDNVEYGLKVVIAELRSSRPNLALETIEELRTRRIQDPRLFVHTAHAHLSLGQPAAALAAAEQAIDSAAPLMSRSVIARAQYLRARAFFGLGHYERALESLKSSRDELVGLGDFSLAVRTQATFSCWLALHGHQAPAQEMLEQAHELAKGYGGPGDLARIESAAAQIAGLRGEVHAAKAHLLRAVAFYEELGDEQAVANAFNSLGARALDVPELEEAQKYFSSALAKFESLQDRRRARGARSNLALIALLRGDVASASGQFRTLIESSKGDPHGSGSAPLNLAKAQFETGRLGEAMDLVEAALDTARKSQSRPVLEDGQQTLARIHLHRGDLELARLWFRKSAETGDAIGGPRLELRALTNRVELLLAEGDAVGAESIAREATRLAARHSLGARGSTRLVAQALLHRGDVAQARQTLEGLETRGDDLETRRIGILEARIRALTGDHKLAVQSLHEISRWAKERGAWTIDTEANLALVEAERPRQGPEWTRGRLTSIETDSCGRSWASYCRRAKQLASGDDRGPGRGVSGLEAVME